MTALSPTQPRRHISPLSRYARIEETTEKLWKHELRELARGFCGALFVALPLLYTQEMWSRAREIEPAILALIIVLTYIINLGYVCYSNFKVGIRRVSIFWDALLSMGLGALASIITLLITARISLETPSAIFVALIALMTLPTSFGASLAINQLGKRGSNDTDNLAERRFNPDVKKIVATALGGILFAFNIGPTIEPKVMLGAVSAEHAIAIALFSLFISYIIENTAQFHIKEEQQTDNVLSGALLSTGVTYLVALLVSAGLLWAFGYLNTGTPPEMAIIWVIIVGYSTTLGGAAGRLIL